MLWLTRKSRLRVFRRRRKGFLSGWARLNTESRPWVGRLFFKPLHLAWAQPCCWRVAPQQSPFPRPAAVQKYE